MGRGLESLLRHQFPDPGGGARGPRSRLARMLLRLISRLPLPVLYALFGLVACILRAVRWRRNLVDDGLGRCLPEKSAPERAAIAREFYRGLGRLAAEVMHGSRIPVDELERHRVVGTEEENAGVDEVEHGRLSEVSGLQDCRISTARS